MIKSCELVRSTCGLLRWESQFIFCNCPSIDLNASHLLWRSFPSSASSFNFLCYWPGSPINKAFIVDKVLLCSTDGAQCGKMLPRRTRQRFIAKIACRQKRQLTISLSALTKGIFRTNCVWLGKLDCPIMKINRILRSKWVGLQGLVNNRRWWPRWAF